MYPRGVLQVSHYTTAHVHECTQAYRHVCVIEQAHVSRYFGSLLILKLFYASANRINGLQITLCRMSWWMSWWRKIARN